MKFNKNKQAFFCSVELIFLFFYVGFICPIKIEAFLAASGVPLLAATLLPQILIFLLNFLLTIIAFVKRKKVLSTLLLLALLGGGIYLTKEYLFLKKINVNPEINSLSIADDKNMISKEKNWENFKSSIQSSNSNEIWINFIDADKSHLSNIQDLKVTNYEQEKYKHIIGYTLVDYSLEGTTIDLARDFFIDIFSIAFDQEKLEKLLTEKGITKSDEILVYCPGGSTSRIVAFILNHYGYKIHYLPLRDMENSNLKNQNEMLFFIKNIDKDQLKDHQYIIFMMMVNDYYHETWSKYYCGGDSLPRNFHFYKTGYENESEIIYCSQDRSISVLASDLKIPLIEPTKITNLNNSRVLCYDRWHCFLTQHVLFEYKLHQQFPTLYCLSCEGGLDG